MEKAIKWQIAFQTNDPTSSTNYRIDIYSEGYSGTPIQLTAGPQPFVTEEDKNTDFFTPVRSQTGTIQVCTRLSDGSILDINDLLPADNIAHPVRLINLSNSNAIEWQGFMSCEAFSQAYTEVPEIFSFPIISVLEAMDSVEVSQTRSSGLSNIAGATYNVLNEINIQSGMTLFTYINFSQTSWRIFQKAIDQTLFFKRNEYNNENSTTYIVSGISSLNALRRLCVFMGWIAREQGTELYLEYIGETIGMYRVAFANFVQSVILHPGTMPTKAITSQAIADSVWRGTAHKRSIAQGAKSVEVVANLAKYDIGMSLPPFPYGNTEIFYRKISYTEWLYIVANKNTSAYSNLTFKFFKGAVNIPLNVQNYIGERTLQDVFASMIAVNPEIEDINIGIVASPPYQAEITAGAFLAQVAYETQQQSGHTTNNGLYVVWLPQAWDTGYHLNDLGELVNTDVFENLDAIFTVNNQTSIFLHSGYLKLSASMKHLIYEYDDYHDVGHIYSDSSEWEDNLLFHIKIGDKYWTGSGWSTTPSKVWINIKGSNFEKNWTPSDPVEETDGYIIPITDTLSGVVEIGIYAPIHAYEHGFKLLAETFFSQLSIDYLNLEDDTRTDRSANHYCRLLGTNFSDEVSIGTDLASMLNNLPSPSLIMEDATTPMKELNYGTSQSPDMRRPEVDLLNRLATYYGAARQRLELEVKHPTDALLPLLRLNGISPDTRVYLPLSEKRDWKAEVCTLTCFETPN